MLKPPTAGSQARGTLSRGLDFAFGQYGSAEHMQSSSTVQQNWHEAANSYAPGMERQTFGFGARLKAAREKAGMSGTTLGKGAGENGKDASKASVSDWEKERHYPKADQLRVICLRLNINVDDLIFGDIREQWQMIQAESAIRALSDEQRQLLLDRITRKAPSAPKSVEKLADKGEPERGNPFRVGQVPHQNVTESDGGVYFLGNETTREGVADAERDPDTKPKRESAEGKKPPRAQT